MASIRKTPGGKFELCIRHKLLPKRIHLTFSDKVEAEQYGEQCEALLSMGVVPAGLAPETRARPKERLSFILRAWINSGDPAPSELEVLELLVNEVGSLNLEALTYSWAQDWVKNLKLVANYSPGTIRKRVGALSRCIDSYLRLHPDVSMSNSLKLLPRGAATYNAQDAALAVGLGKKAKVDVVRERRLLPGEAERIMSALAGEKRKGRERPMMLKDGEALRVLFLVILNTGIRLREAYTLHFDQVLLDKRVLRVKSSKQWYGRVSHREVPMRKELHAELTRYLAANECRDDEPIFPWWDGQVETMPKVTAKLSSQFGRLFRFAQCEGLTEHDLRHEATCAWYEIKAQDGQWMFRDKEVEKIMGWAPGSSMAARYASFRAEDLAQRLWA